MSNKKSNEGRSFLELKPIERIKLIRKMTASEILIEYRCRTLDQAKEIIVIRLISGLMQNHAKNKEDRDMHIHARYYYERIIELQSNFTPQENDNIRQMWVKRCYAVYA